MEERVMGNGQRVIGNGLIGYGCAWISLSIISATSIYFLLFAFSQAL
jgi:hypothetical protein